MKKVEDLSVKLETWNFCHCKICHSFLSSYHLEGKLSPLEENYDNFLLHSSILCTYLNHLAHYCMHMTSFETGRPVLNQVNGHNLVFNIYTIAGGQK